MSYTKKTWASGDTVTSTALNNMENGIANAEPLIVTASNVNGSMKADKTFAEVSAAISAGRFVYMINRVSKQVLMLSKIEETKISFECVFPDSNTKKGIRGMLQSNDVLAFSETNPYFKPNNGIPETDLAQAVQDKLNPFIVTLTPTELDLSGTMDKTPEEINAAYNAGLRIRFYVPDIDASVDASEYIVLDVDGVPYVSVWANILYQDAPGGGDVLMNVQTSVSASEYSTYLYPLTPMSS